MAKINFGGVEEDVVTREEFPLEMAREVLKNEVGVQSRASTHPEDVGILLKRTQERIPLNYLALDGHFGHNDAMQMVRQCGLHLISKLRSDAALYLPYDGPYCGHAQPKKYGNKINYNHLPEKHLKPSFVEGGIQTCIYQATMLHKEFAQSLNVVIIAKTNLQTQARAHVVLFSSDLDLPFDKPG